MFSRLTKEFLAWIALAFAILLFSVTIAFAQSPRSSKKEKEKGVVSLKIVKKNNGNTVRIDTTFDLSDEAALEKVLRDLDVDIDVHDAPDASGKEAPHRRHGKKNMVLHFNDENLSSKEQAEIEKDMREAMESARQAMKEAADQLKELHIEINGEGEEGHFNFDFSLPDPPLPPCPPHGMDFNFENREGHCCARNLEAGDFDGIDSLEDSDHLIIYGEKGEKAPEFEKEIVGKNGRKAFIYRRQLDPVSAPDESSDRSALLVLEHLRYYPNPSNGKFDLAFHSEGKGNLIIRIFDDSGAEIYKESIRDFSGEYSNQIDISGQGKGNYILKIEQDDKSLSKKIVVE